jgi:hypothetical protein
MDTREVRSLAKTYMLLADVLDELALAGITADPGGDGVHGIRTYYEWDFPRWRVTAEFACCDFESIQLNAMPFNIFASGARAMARPACIEDPARWTTQPGDSIVWDYLRQERGVAVREMVGFVRSFSEDLPEIEQAYAIGTLIRDTNARWWSLEKSGPPMSVSP